MNSITITSSKDLYSLKDADQFYDQIIINLRYFKANGLVRHALKYSNYALKIKGKMIIHSSPFESYVLRRNKIDFWQVKYEVFNSLRDSVSIEEVDNKKGTLVLQKEKHPYTYNGISFGIVFSGSKAEEQQLKNSIESIAKNFLSQHISYEILICGPTTYDPSDFFNDFEGIKLKYLSLDIPTKPRLLICEKKNYLFKNASFNLVVISHSRILFSGNFVSTIMKYPIEMATPVVSYKDNDKVFKYLDIAFINSYQDIQLGAKSSTIAGENIKKNYLQWYRKRVPFIDGGLNIFNKNVIAYPPYNNYISWGEAEDVDICNRLFQNGILIDYIPEAECYSATCKVTGYKNQLKRLGREVYVYLHRKRIIN